MEQKLFSGYRKTLELCDSATLELSKKKSLPFPEGFCMYKDKKLLFSFSFSLFAEFSIFVLELVDTSCGVDKF